MKNIKVYFLRQMHELKKIKPINFLLLFSAGCINAVV